MEKGTNTGTMEFEMEAEDVGMFFPVAVEFVSQKGICGVEVSLLSYDEVCWASAYGQLSSRSSRLLILLRMLRSSIQSICSYQQTTMLLFRA